MRALLLGLLALTALAQDRISINAGTLLDGRGAILKNQRIVIESGRIVSVTPAKGKADYDLSALTVMPGWIDTHIHLNWYMDANRKSVSGGAKPEDSALYTAADAWMTLQNGFTTVQSVGAAIDGPVRDRINDGVIPGPRVLTSLIQIQASGGGRGQQHTCAHTAPVPQGCGHARNDHIAYRGVNQEGHAPHGISRGAHRNRDAFRRFSSNDRVDRRDQALMTMVSAMRSCTVRRDSPNIIRQSTSE